MPDERKSLLNDNESACSRQSRGLLTEFQFSVLTNNTIGGITPITRTVGDPPVTLASLSLLFDSDGLNIWLAGTAAFQAAASSFETVVEYRLYRDAPVTGTLIFNTFDTTPNPLEFITTSINQVDFPAVAVPTSVFYFLVAVVLNGTATFSGPITFTGAKILPNGS